MKQSFFSIGKATCNVISAAPIIKGCKEDKVRQCLDFCKADFRSWLVYESAIQKPKHNLFLFALLVNNQVRELNNIRPPSSCRLLGAAARRRRNLLPLTDGLPFWRLFLLLFDFVEVLVVDFRFLVVRQRHCAVRLRERCDYRANYLKIR